MQKNTADWHRADVVAALKKAGWSVRALSVANELRPDTLRNALYCPFYPKGEKIIADALDMKPEDIWPQRHAAQNFRPTLRKVANA